MDKLEEMLAPAGDVRFRPMFGEYGIYLGEKFIGVVADDMLFLKKTNLGEKHIGPGNEAPPYPGASPALCVPESKMADSVWLTEFVTITAEALPAPKPKKKKS